MIERTSHFAPFVTRVACVLINLLALHLLVRGHDAPGGGFIAGMATAISFVLLALGNSVPAARRMLRFPPARIAAAGGLVVVGSAAAPLLTGDPLLAPYAFELGDFSLRSALIFECGVYFIVVGATAKLIFTFGLSSEGHPAFAEAEEELYRARGEEPVERHPPHHRHPHPQPPEET